MNPTTKVWFVTDIHGSDICFRKFVNAGKTRKNPDVMIVGGDVTGKWLVPIVKWDSMKWRAEFAGERHTFTCTDELEVYEKKLADQGAYSMRCEPEMAIRLRDDLVFQDEMLKELRRERIARWVELADRTLSGSGKKVYINAGNDDPFYIDDVLRSSKTMYVPEGKVVEVDQHLTMASTGFCKRTPWNCPRDVEDDQLKAIVQRMMQNVSDPSKCIFNFHCPPYGTSLDHAVKLDEEKNPQMTGFGAEEISVGSPAIRKAIEDYQPCVTLHGHIHEVHGYVRIGRSICFNPGSEYEKGLLRGVYLEFERGTLRRFGLTREDMPP